MLEEGVLFEHYERTLKPRVRALEKHREALVAAWKRVAVGVGLPGSLAYLTADSRSLRVVFWLAAIALVVGLVTTLRPLLADRTLTLGAYRQRFKRDLVSQVFRIVLPQARYFPNQGLDRRGFDEPGLFSERVDSYESDDLVRGRIGATPFEAADVQASYTTGSGKKRKTWDVIRGLYLRLDFNKHLRGRTIVEPESGPAWRMGSRGGLSKVTLEDPDFERQYAVYTSDPVEARYVLTPVLMERILAVEAVAGHPIHLAFVGSHVHIAVHYGRELFEPSLLASVSYEAVVEIARLFGLAEVIVAELELNVRIWTKGAAPEAEAASAPPVTPAATGTGAAAIGRAQAGVAPPVPRRVAPPPVRQARPEPSPSRLSRGEVLSELRGASELRERARKLAHGGAGGLAGWIGFGVGTAAFMLAGRAMQHNPPRDGDGLLGMIVGGAAFLAAFIAFAVLTTWLAGNSRRLVLALGVAFFWFGVVAPMQRDAAESAPTPAPVAAPTPTAAEQEAQRRARVEEQRRRQEEERLAREAMAAHLRATGAHGPLGTVPPIVTVYDGGSLVAVTNPHEPLLWVALHRIEESASAPSGYRACGFDASIGRERDGFGILKKGETVEFTLKSPCDGSFEKAPLEFRVGRNTGDVGWWSDTALAAPHGHRTPY